VSKKIPLKPDAYNTVDIEAAISKTILCIAAETAVNKVVVGHIKGLLKEGNVYVTFNCTKVDVVLKSTSDNYYNYIFLRPVLYLEVILLVKSKEDIEQIVDACICTSLSSYY
jgi:hypothetical protein